MGTSRKLARVIRTHSTEKMTLKGKKKSLADKINSLVTTTPITFNSDAEDEDTTAKVIDRYDESDDANSDFQTSEIRKRTVDHLDQIDERYKGKKVSRKDIYNNNDDFNSQSILESEDEEMGSMEGESDMINTDDEESIKSNITDANSSAIDNNENDQEDDESDIEDDESDIEDDESDIEDDESDIEDDESDIEDDESDIKEESDTSPVRMAKSFQTMSKINANEEIERGNCVRNQLNIWESLLEVRIKLQKCLAVSNQMPQYDICKNFKMDPQYTKAMDETNSKLKLLLNNILQLRYFLLKQYSETRNLCDTNYRKRKAEDSTSEHSSSDAENDNGNKDAEDTFKKKLKLGGYEEILNNNHKSYINYRNSVIQKWNEKTRVASGKLNKGTSETTLKQIDFALSDREKLRKKSRLKSSEYKIVGKTETTDNIENRTQEYDNEVYVDDEFYHQLLRDLIEYKSSDITDSVPLSKQWIKLQSMRSKIKKRVDTKATKGRKIRYNVHNKLVNFMAPITVNDTWTDHAKNDLYSSLFGKVKPTNVK